MTEREGFLASITLNIRAIMYESGTIRQGELENEILRRLGLFDDTTKHATVKRRIYDALSTFIALEIIYKVDKTLHWNGFPRCTMSLTPQSADTNDTNDLNADTVSSTSSEHSIAQVQQQAYPPKGASGSAANDEFSQLLAGDSSTDEEVTAEELQAQIAELESQINILNQKNAYYSFFNNQTATQPSLKDRDQTNQSVNLPFTVMAAPSEADLAIFSNADRTCVSVSGNMRNITTLSDEQIVRALVKNAEKSMGQFSPF